MVTVSVVIPTYNRSNVIRRAIESAKDQSIKSIEIIVVDDASSDNTEQVVSSLSDDRVKYIRHENNRGGGAARNTGINNANGEYIAFLDSDDVWHEKKLQKQLAYLKQLDEEWVACYCGHERKYSGRSKAIKTFAEQFIPSKRVTGMEGGQELIDDLLCGNLGVGGASTIVIRKDVVQQIGGFDERFPRHQDWEFLIRVLKRGRIAYVPDTLVTKFEENTITDPRKIRTAKRLFLEKFANELSGTECNGVNALKIHQYELARVFFKQGEFKEGYNHLKQSHPNGVKSVLALFWSLLIGTNRVVRS